VGLEVIQDERGISVSTLEGCGVRWIEGDDYAVRFSYPNLAGVWYERLGLDPRLPRSDRPKILSPPNAEHHLYNPLKLGPNAGFVIFTEGEYDTLSVINAGYPAVGTQGTGTFKAPWVRLFTGAITIVMFDSDTAGINAAHKFRKWHTEAGGVSHIKIGEDGTDLNDLLMDNKLEDYIQEFLEAEGIEYDI